MVVSAILPKWLWPDSEGKIPLHMFTRTELPFYLCCDHIVCCCHCFRHNDHWLLHWPFAYFFNLQKPADTWSYHDHSVCEGPLGCIFVFFLFSFCSRVCLLTDWKIVTPGALHCVWQLIGMASLCQACVIIHWRFCSTNVVSSGIANLFPHPW